MDNAAPIDGFGYWDNHPAFAIVDSQYEVANGDTRQSYWAWVKAQLGEIEI